jgi:hypothetical protein
MSEDVQVVSNHSDSTDDAERRHPSPLDLDTTLKKSLGKSLESGCNCGSAVRRNWGLEYPERSGPVTIESRMVSPTQSRGDRFTHVIIYRTLWHRARCYIHRFIQPMHRSVVKSK